MRVGILTRRECHIGTGMPTAAALRIARLWSFRSIVAFDRVPCKPPLHTVHAASVAATLPVHIKVVVCDAGVWYLGFHPAMTGWNVIQMPRRLSRLVHKTFVQE